MRSTGLSRRFAVGGRWYEDRAPRRQTIAERNNEKVNLTHKCQIIFSPYMVGDNSEYDLGTPSGMQIVLLGLISVQSHFLSCSLV